VSAPIRVAVVARAVALLHAAGGLERSVLDLVRYLAAHDVEVRLITRPPAGPVDAARPAHALGPHVTTTFVPYRTFPFAGRRGTTVLDRATAYPLFGMRAGYAAWQLVQQGRIDLVHGFGASVLGYARRRRHAAAPLVLNPQGLEEFGATDPGRAPLKRLGYLPLRAAVRACAAAADCVIATDRALEPAVRRHLGIPPGRIRVIPNALDLDRLDRLGGVRAASALRTARGIPPDEPVLLSVGRLQANKGFHVLAAALGALRRHGAATRDTWRWVVVGDGPYRRHLERAVAAAGIADRTVLTGPVTDEDLHAWYDTATLFVHPTLYEGSSLVTLEAMAHGLAVVASAAGGIPDKVRPGVNGWLVPPGEPDALAAAVSGALGHPDRLREMGSNGRTIVETEFSWSAAGAATIGLYRELLGGRL
jgi:glycogen synthase